ncbi:hypothetical protein Dimus_024203, partial [Dionaea muscipula]
NSKPMRMSPHSKNSSNCSTTGIGKEPHQRATKHKRALSPSMDTPIGERRAVSELKINRRAMAPASRGNGDIDDGRRQVRRAATSPHHHASSGVQLREKPPSSRAPLSCAASFGHCREARLIRQEACGQRATQMAMRPAPLFVQQGWRAAPLFV